KEKSDGRELVQNGSASTVAALQLLKEPGPGVRPQQIGRAGRDAQDLGRLVAGQAGEKAELDQFRRPRVGAGQLVQQLVELEEVVTRFVPDDQGFVQVDAGALATVLDAALAAGPLGRGAGARARRGGGEATAARAPLE